MLTNSTATIIVCDLYSSSVDFVDKLLQHWINSINSINTGNSINQKLNSKDFSANVRLLTFPLQNRTVKLWHLVRPFTFRSLPPLCSTIDILAICLDRNPKHELEQKRYLSNLASPPTHILWLSHLPNNSSSSIELTFENKQLPVIQFVCCTTSEDKQVALQLISSLLSHSSISERL